MDNKKVFNLERIAYIVIRLIAENQLIKMQKSRSEVNKQIFIEIPSNKPVNVFIA